MAKPSVNTKPVASQYAALNERIIEFTNGSRSAEAHKGGLIAFRDLDDGTFLVSVYRTDPGVIVTREGDDEINKIIEQAVEITRDPAWTEDAGKVADALVLLTQLAGARRRACNRVDEHQSHAWPDIFKGGVYQCPGIRHNATDEAPCTECGHWGNGQVPGCTRTGCDS